MLLMKVYIALFLAYAILGWCMEVVVKFVEYKRFINRGFLIGPYCPIYGMGALLITFLLDRFKERPVVVFILGLLVASVLEYITSWAMEKMFHARWWDYSNDKFNINGRVCLETMIPFGILGLLIIYILNPVLIGVCERMGNDLLCIIVSVLGGIFLIDGVISTVILSTFKNDSEEFLAEDNTEEMSKKVKDILAKITWGQRRLIVAFPNLKHVGYKLKENAKEALERYNKVIEQIKDKYYSRG
ncbi:MAG: putative ABC transporter permease [Clostridiales bacterium]|nr:putative ABC transporter permease [Clostridiales bacterium]